MGLARTLQRVVIGLGVAAGLGSAALLYLLRRPLPKTRGRRRLKGLRSPVEVIRDKWGVPHIYASNLRDLIYALGYVQAQDRFWQMELYRRGARGTLAEVLGEAALEVDRLTRHVGFGRIGAKEWEGAGPEARALLEAFSAGINGYLESVRLPLEFTLLRYRPKPWHPVDTIAFAKFMAWSLNGNWDTEILRSWTIERFGVEAMMEVEPRYGAEAPLIVPPGAEARGAGPPLDEEFGRVREVILAMGRSLSNNWAVDGAKSATGKPLLANDPHLVLQMPSIWYEVHLDSPELKVAGACLPGTPAVLIGHNERIAWGITAALADGDDLFVERLNPANPRQYEFQGQWLDAEVVREEIKVRGRQQPQVEEVLITRHGPIISPCIRGETRPLALRSTALEGGQQMESLLLLMSARNWEEFREALRHWGASPSNFAYADVDGNIGYQLAGIIPLRAKGYGLVPSPGWTEEFDWTGFIPFEELPQAYNPETHWVASANNKIVDDDYPYFLGCGFVDGYRQERIIELLGAKEKLSLEDFKAMQADVYSIPGRALASFIQALEPQDPWSRRAQTFVKAWTADSVAAAIVEAFFAHLVRLALEEKLGSWSAFFLGRGIHPLQSGSFFIDAAAWLLAKVEQRPQWFKGKSWQEAMEEALAAAVAELRRLLGDDMSRWQWGRLHTQTFRHVMGQVPALARLFNRGPLSLGGDANTVAQAAYNPHRGYEVTSWTVSYRQIIDLSNFNNSLAVLPTGQSGHPGSRHYADMMELWRRVEYHPLPWDRPDVEAVARARLLLEPAGDGTP